MKVSYVADHQNKKEIEMVTRSGTHYLFPYARMSPQPSEHDPIRRIYVDPEIASVGVTYFLTSGQEGAVLLDHVFTLRKEQVKRRVAHNHRDVTKRRAVSKRRSHRYPR